MIELGRYPNRRWIPSLISLTGLAPALLLLDPGFHPYLWWILVFQLLCDDLDGMAARALAAETQFGRDLDDVCDAVAHPVIVLIAGIGLAGPWYWVAWILAVAIVFRTVTRLQERPRTHWGLPSNDVVLLVGGAWLLKAGLDIDMTWFAGLLLPVLLLALFWPRPVHLLRTRLQRPFWILGYNLTLAGVGLAVIM